MLLGHLSCGICLGALVAVASALSGFSLLGVLGFALLGANLGLAASALGALSVTYGAPRFSSLRG